MTGCVVRRRSFGRKAVPSRARGAELLLSANRGCFDSFTSTHSFAQYNVGWCWVRFAYSRPFQYPLKLSSFFGFGESEVHGVFYYGFFSGILRYIKLKFLSDPLFIFRTISSRVWHSMWLYSLCLWSSLIYTECFINKYNTFSQVPRNTYIQ